jgi:hypothetical protein
MMNRKQLYITIIILVIGALLRLYTTSNGHYIFHMDSARDYIDVREMVLFKKFRLIGPTSAIAGLYTGPGWYYLLSLPFMLSGGNPYGSIILEIISWGIGGFFLMKLASRYGKLPMLLSGLIWIFSNFMMLQTAYSFHPNMITLLTPLFIFILTKYLSKPTYLYATSTFLLAGMFFQLEMNFGVFMVPIIISSIIINRRWGLFLSKSFWIGFISFIITLLPQIIFDFKYSHMMINAVLNFIDSSPKEDYITTLLLRAPQIYQSFNNILLPTFMNFKPLAIIMDISLLVFLFLTVSNKQLFQDRALLVSYLFLIVPFFGYILLPVSVNPWHLGGVVAASIVVSSYIFGQIFSIKNGGTIFGWILAALVFYSSSINLINYVKEHQTASGDPSLIINEVAAIDYVYQEAQGKDFTVYTYLPSVYDYPYQYLFWSYGQKRYGYLPKEYSYAPNKPAYISGKEGLKTSKPADSDLVFLIKEPDNPERRGLWENNFTNYPLIKRYRIQSIEVEVRKSPS